MERTEASGFGVALVGHIALIVALKFLLDTSGALTPPPAMEVSFAEDVGLVSTAPDTEASAPALGDEPGPAEDAAGGEASVPESEPVAEPEPARTPSPSTPRDRPEEPRRNARSNVPSQARPQPQRQPQRQATRPGSGPAERSRGSRLPSAGSFGDDAGTSRQQAAVASPQVRASIRSIIAGELRNPRCRNQASPAPEARAIRVTMTVTLARDGSIESMSNVRVRNDDPNAARYETRVRELAVALLRCVAPFSQLASRHPEFYQNYPAGWRTFPYGFPE